MGVGTGVAVATGVGSVIVKTGVTICRAKAARVWLPNVSRSTPLPSGNRLSGKRQLPSASLVKFMVAPVISLVIEPDRLGLNPSPSRTTRSVVRMVAGRAPVVVTGRRNSLSWVRSRSSPIVATGVGVTVGEVVGEALGVGVGVAVGVAVGVGVVVLCVGVGVLVVVVVTVGVGLLVVGVVLAVGELTGTWAR